MDRETAQEWKILLLLISVFLGAAIIAYFPILGGKIPFPAQVATDFPPWDSVRSQPIETAPRAEYGDVVTLFYPWRYFQAASVRRGELPLWNPHILSGAPFLANAQSAIFYPPNALFYVLPMPLAWTLKLLLNTIFAGALTALFVRSIGGNIAGALAAGIAFAFCGFMTVWQAYTLADAMVWIPLICLAVHRLCVRADTWNFILTTIAFALPALAGHPETAAHLTIVGCAFAMWQSFLASHSFGMAARRLALFATAGLLAIGLTSIQMVPTLEWLGQINHTAQLLWNPPGFHELLTFVSRDIARTPNSSGLNIPETAAYVGAFTLLLAPLGFLHRSKREAFFFLMLIVVAVQIIVGWGPAHWAAQHTPLIQGIKNWRLLGVVDFSLAVLAGLGISVSCDTDTRLFARRYFWIVPAVTLVTALAASWLLQTYRHSPVHWLITPFSSVIFMVAGYFLLLLQASGRLRPNVFGAVAVALFALDLVTFAHGYMPFARPGEVFPDAPVFRFLKEHDPSQSRVVTLDDASIVNSEMMYGLSGIGGFELSLRLIKTYLDDLGAPSLDAISLRSEKVVSSNDRRLDLLNARYFITSEANESYGTLAAHPERFSLVLSDGSVRLFENRRALNRVIFIPATKNAIEVLPDEEAQLARLKDSSFDPERSVVLASPPPHFEDLDGAAQTNANCLISWTDHSAQNMELKVTAGAPGVLVLSQIFYPGWRVFVDDVEAPTMRANYALMGVAIKEGMHSVRFVFRPKTFRIGLATTIVSMLVLVFLSVSRRCAICLQAAPSPRSRPRFPG